MRYGRPTLARIRTARRLLARSLSSGVIECIASADPTGARMDRDSIAWSIRDLDTIIREFSSSSDLAKSVALNTAMADRRFFLERAQRFGCMGAI